MKQNAKSIKNDTDAVSTIIGYTLTLVMCGMILTGSTYTMSMLVEKRTEAAARMEAQAIADRVVDIILDAAHFSQSRSSDNY
jgi:hypothetical protein